MDYHVTKPMRLVGLQFTDSLHLVNKLKIGTRLELRAVKNSHDAHAVGVFYKDKRIGFIERGQSQGVKRLIKGRDSYIVVSRVDKQADLYDMVLVLVYYEKLPEDSIGPVVCIRRRKDGDTIHVWRMHTSGVSYSMLDASTTPSTCLVHQFEITEKAYVAP